MSAAFQKRWHLPNTLIEVSDKSDKTPSGTFVMPAIEPKLLDHAAKVQVLLASNPDPQTLARTLFEYLMEILSYRSGDVPQRVDDMTARCINRGGGWVRIAQD